jgi:uncharacterized protein (TIGR02231 family)
MMEESDGESSGETESAPEEEYSTVQDTGLSVLFKLTDPSDIPADNQSHRVTMSRFLTEQGQSSLRLTSAVRRPYYTVRLKNDRPFPLMAGKADVYRSSGYMGVSQIPYVPSGATFVAGFGSDESASFRRYVEDSVESSGMLGSTKIYHIRVKVIVTNHDDKARSFEALEQIPVSDLEEVKVKIESDTTAGYEEERPGVLRWKKEIPSGQTEHIILHYTVQADQNFPPSLIRPH